MNILHIIIRLEITDGGPSQGLAALATAQARQGDNVTILPCTTSGNKMVLEPGNYGTLKVLKPPTNKKIIFPNLDLKNAIEKEIKHADIVHVHGTWRYYVIVVDKLSKKFNIPFIIRPAGNLGRIPRKNKGFLKWPYFTFIEKPIINRAKAIHCCTNKELLELEDLKLKPKKFVIPQPVDNSLINIKPNLDKLKEVCPNLKEDDILLLYLGRISWIKRLPLLVKGFAQISKEFYNSHLVVAGTWEDMNLIKELKAIITSTNNSQRITILGMVEGEIKATLFKRANLFVQPSMHENFGLSVAEALSYGKPCLVSDGVGLSEEIKNFKAGLIFQGNIESLVSSLREILSNPNLLEEFTNNTLKFKDFFNSDSIARKIKLEYKSVLTK